MNILGFDINLHSTESLICLSDYEKKAQKKLPRMVNAYVNGGADTEATLRANRTGLEQLTLMPRALTGVGTPNLTTTIGGQELDLPVLLAPTGFTGLSHWKGDLLAAAAAESRGTKYVVSTASSWAIEDIAAHAKEPHFFQLYPHTGSVAKDLLARAHASGYSALMLTVDVPVRGNRIQERHEGMGIPPVLTPRRLLNISRHPKWALDVIAHGRIGGGNFSDSRSVNSAIESIEIQERELMLDTLNWSDVAWIRDHWNKPLYIKGIARPEDAVRAIAAGADGIVVSNHGGRQLDAMPATIDLLPAIVEVAQGKIEILIDGGFRTGTDIAKALALGADAVMIGRPYIHGLAVSGQQGVEAILDILKHELSDAFSLLGVKRVTDLDATSIFTRHPSERISAHV